MQIDNLPVHIAETEKQRYDIYRFRYQLYIETLKRSSSGAIPSERILRECFDHRSILLYSETPDGKIAGTVSLLQGPFEAAVKQRIQTEFIEQIQHPKIDPKNLFYISKFMVANDQRKASVGNALLLASFCHSSKLGGVVGFIHCSKAIIRYFKKWGCVQYGVPFEYEDLGKQYPLAISTTYKQSHINVESPILRSDYVFPDNPDADSFFKKLTQDISR